MYLRHFRMKLSRTIFKIDRMFDIVEEYITDEFNIKEYYYIINLFKIIIK